MTKPYEHVYRHIDPDNLPETDDPPFQGSQSECFAEACLDVIHIALDSGMTMDEMNAAMLQVVDHVARLNRERFKVHAAK